MFERKDGERLCEKRRRVKGRKRERVKRGKRSCVCVCVRGKERKGDYLEWKAQGSRIDGVPSSPLTLQQQAKGRVCGGGGGGGGA